MFFADCDWQQSANRGHSARSTKGVLFQLAKTQCPDEK
jgi:hypothetical protein